jgi:hypothetical protein
MISIKNKDNQVLFERLVAYNAYYKNEPRITNNLKEVVSLVFNSESPINKFQEFTGTILYPDLKMIITNELWHINHKHNIGKCYSDKIAELLGTIKKYSDNKNKLLDTIKKLRKQIHEMNNNTITQEKEQDVLIDSNEPPAKKQKPNNIITELSEDDVIITEPVDENPERKKLYFGYKPEDYNVYPNKEYETFVTGDLLVVYNC